MVNYHVNRLISFHIFEEKPSLWSQFHFSHSLLAGCFPALRLIILFIQTGTGGHCLISKLWDRILLVSCTVDVAVHYLGLVALGMSNGAPVFPHRENLPSSTSLPFPHPPLPGKSDTQTTKALVDTQLLEVSAL